MSEIKRPHYIDQWPTAGGPTGEVTRYALHLEERIVLLQDLIDALATGIHLY